MVNSRLSRGLSVAAILAVVGANAYAVNLVPGDLSTPISGMNSATLPTLTGGIVLQSQVRAFASDYWSGELRTTVVKETTGKLSFLYQLKMITGGLHNVTRLTTVDFTGFSTDVDFFSDNYTGFGFTAPVNPPSNPYFADRQTADVVGFAFRDGKGITGLSAGQTTNVLYIRTDATRYTEGDSYIIDGRVASVQTFAPASAVPGPMAIIPFGVGLVAAFLRKRR